MSCDTVLMYVNYNQCWEEIIRFLHCPKTRLETRASNRPNTTWHPCSTSQVFNRLSMTGHPCSTSQVFNHMQLIVGSCFAADHTPAVQAFSPSARCQSASDLIAASMLSLRHQVLCRDAVRATS